MFSTQPRLTKDNITIGAVWGPTYELYDIWSLWCYIQGGDCMIRWAPLTGHDPNFNYINPDGEILPSPGGSFDQLDNDHGRFQFKLANPVSAATLSFKAQRRPSGLMVVGA